MVKDVETSEVNPELVAVICFDPARLMLRSLKVANPPELVTRERVPLNVPVPDVKASVIVTPEDATLALNSSFSCTVTEGLIVCPAVVVVGC